MKIVKFLLLATFLASCSGKEPYPYKTSDFRREIEVHLNKLALEKSIPVKDTIAMNYLKENCNKEELLQLLECDNPILRVVAYRSIVNRQEKDYFDILLGHLNDTITVKWWYCEDAVDDFMVSDLLIRKALDGNKLTQNQKDILVDSVLSKHLYLKVSNWMIQDIDPNERYYSLIKKRCSIKTDRCGEQLGACYALSKYKKKDDLEFLADKFQALEYPCEDWIFKAIENNPEEIYFPLLEKYLNEQIKKKKPFSYNELEYYCKAVAAYSNTKSLNLLRQLTNKATYTEASYFDNNEEFVFRALHKYRSPIYEDLYTQLRPKMNSYVMKSLDRTDYRDRKVW